MLKSLFKHIYLSCTTLSWYGFLNKVSFSSHFLALLLTLVIGSFVSALRFYAVELPLIEKNVQTVLSTTNDNFADDLFIEWDGLKLHINRNNLLVPVPNLFAQENPYDNTSTLFISSEPLDTSSAQALLESHAFVADTTISYIKSGDQLSPLALSEVLTSQPFTIQKTTIEETLAFFNTNLHAIKNAILVISPLIFFVSLFFLRLLTLFFDATIIYLLLRLNKATYTFKEILIIAMNVMIPSEIIYQYGRLYGYQGDIPLYALVFWIYMTCALLYSYNIHRYEKMLKNPS